MAESTIHLKSLRINDALQPAGKVNVRFNERLSETPFSFQLKGNFPNPFNPGTYIHYEIDQSGPVQLILFDLLGRKVRQLVNRVHAPGGYTVFWDGKVDGKDAPSGHYICHLRSRQQIHNKKVTKLK